MHRNISTIVILTALCMGMSTLCALNQIPKLTVSGTGNVEKPADKVSLTIGVVTNDQVAKKALNANAEKLHAVREDLLKTGLSEKEMQTGTFSVQPKYSPAPRDVTPDWQPKIVGYEVRNTLSIKTTNLDLLGKIIDASGGGEANLIQDLNFSLQDDQAATSEAIAKAIRQAKAYAESAASSAGIKLGNIIELAVNPSHINPRPYPMAAGLAFAKEMATPITPGNIEVNATVNISYELPESK